MFRLKRGADTPLDAPLSTQKLWPLGYFRTKAVLMREIAERHLVLTAQGAEIFARLPDTFDAAKSASEPLDERQETADGKWMDQ